MKTKRTTLGTMFGKTWGKPLVILVVTGTVIAGTGAGMARAARTTEPMSAGSEADSGPNLQELIDNLKGQSAAAGTPVATKKAVAKVKPASMKKAAKKKSASTTADVTPAASKQAPAQKKSPTTKKGSAGARTRSAAKSSAM